MTEQDQQDEQNFQAAGMTPGQMLSQAREAKGWSIGDISEYTRLSVQCIRDLEADEYRHMAAPVYLHGYFRSYARVVGVPEQMVIDAFKAIEHEYNYAPAASPLMASADDGVPIYKQSGSFKSKKIMRWGSLLVAVCLITLVMLWWHDQRSRSTDNVLMAPTSKAVVVPKHVASHVTKTVAPKAVMAKKSQAVAPKPHVEHPAPVAVTSANTNSDTTTVAPTYTVSPVSNDNAGD